MRKAQKIKLVDRLHHAFVYTCLGIGGLAGIGICVRIYEYVTYIRPQMKADQARIEGEMLNEGKALSDPANEMKL